MSAPVAAGRRHGVLATWDDERGFGFIAPDGGGRRVFAHVSAFPRARRPTVGCEVTYTVLDDSRQRVQASAVRYVSAGRSGRSMRPELLRALAVAGSFLTGVAALVLLGQVQVWVLGIYVVSSAVAALMYRADKAAARRGEWRTAESSLLAVALLGGWPGALVARHVLRHKTTKQPFRALFWITVAANGCALAWVVTRR